jgi:uncharacterized SAM-binding protein YcdF (DUF218 family)
VDLYLFFLALGLFLIADTLFAMGMSNLNAGVVLPAVLGLPLVLYALLGLCAPMVLGIPFMRLLAIVGAAGYGTVALLLSTCVLVTGAYALTRKSTEPDVVLVPGAGLRGDRPSRILRHRLDAAVNAARRYGVSILVTGGKGRQESVTEAVSMRRYLLEQGFPEDRILFKEQAKNTYENLKYSAEVLRPLFPHGCRVLVVTSDFHCFRSALIAKKFFKEVSVLPVLSAWYMWLNFYLRETLSLLNYCLRELFSGTGR